MALQHTPFLDGAMAWLYDGDLPDRCPSCGFDWSIDVTSALQVIRAATQAVTGLVSGRDGMAPAADGGWNATAYLWHLTDMARGWSERWAQLAAEPGGQLVPWDPDVLAGARNYQALPTAAATWALPSATEAFIGLTEGLDPATPFRHGDWGPGDVADAVRWVAHEFEHHRADVAERVRA
jgi:hypothetical protein